MLQLSLFVSELDSRWKMGQLLCRLLERVSSTPALLQPHHDAMVQWVPAAWAASGGEQLLREATLDTAATMLLAVGAAPQVTVGNGR